MMRGAGKLDRRVSFERFTQPHDGLQQVEAWAAHGSSIATEKKDVSDGEKFRAGEVSAVLTARFVVRYSTFSKDLTPKDRIKFEGETFAIFGIKEIGRRKFFEITAGARVDD